MKARRWITHSGALVDERGVALPLAMFVLLILLALMLAFSVLSKTEPVIATNQHLTAQARALAESGVERAIWALSNPSASGGLSAPSAGATAGSPYNGGSFITTASGGFLVTVTGVSSSEVSVQAVGWTPTNDTSDARNRAHRKVAATLVKFPTPGDLPCVICVNGSLNPTGSAKIDARTDTSCGSKKGVGAYGSGVTVTIDGSARVWAYDGNDTENQATDYNIGTSSDFNSFDLSTAQMNALRSYAKSKGTYYQGSQSYSSSNKLPSSGVIFVDTSTGTDLTSTTPAGQIPTVSISGGATPTGGFNGWIIVQGNIDGSGNYGDLKGFLYGAGTLSATGTGSSYFEGIAVSKRVQGGTSAIGGNADFRLNCTAANGNLPTGWMLSSGTYREVSD